jgi:hypothetical protein
VGLAGAERDDLVVIPSSGIGKERSDMFSTSHLYVGAVLAEKRSRAAQERLAATAAVRTPGLKARLDAGAKNVWSFLSGPADRPLTPTISNYPFRG